MQHEETAEELRQKIAALPPVSHFGELPYLSATEYPRPRIYPRGGHPRVMVNADMLPKLRRLLRHEENAGAYADYVKQSEQAVDGILPPVVEGSGRYWNYDERVLVAAEAKAYRYLMSGEEIYAYQAIYATLNYILTLEIWDHPVRYTPGYMFDKYHRYGFTMFVASEIYDWCYDLLTETDRMRIIAGLLSRISIGMEIGFPPTKQGAITGHGSETQFLKDWLSFAIATYDERPDIYDFVMGRIEKEYVPFREFYFRSGMQSQGNSYGPARFVCDLIGARIARVATGEDLFRVDMREVARSFIHNLRPDETHLRIGDDMGQRSDPYNFCCYDTCLFYAASMYGDPIAKSEAFRIGQNIVSFSRVGSYFTGVTFLCVNDPELGQVGRESLPTYVYNGSPVGQVIARSAWNDPNAVQVYMKIGEYYAANHEHKDCGQFQIFYRGILASDSGFYDAYGTKVDAGYTKTTLAHNCILIYDPGEKMASFAQHCRNTGGQNSESTESRNLEDWLARSQTRRGEVLGHEILPDAPGVARHVYLAGDLTRAYVPSKSKEVKRYMYGVFTRNEKTPFVFFVFDKVSATNPDFKKTFLLHCEREPEVTGACTVLRNKGGVLVNRTLLPRGDSLCCAVVEGSYLYDGENPTITRLDDTIATCERGWGRVELSAARGRHTDCFLNVMYVTGEENTDPVETPILLETEAFVGASLLGCAALFPKDGTVRSETELVLAGEGELYTSVAGIAPGTWEVLSADGELRFKAAVSAEGGLLTFSAPAGTYRIRPTDAQ